MICLKCKEETDYLAYVAKDLVTGIYSPMSGIDSSSDAIEEEWFKCPNCLETLATSEGDAEELFGDEEEEK